MDLPLFEISGEALEGLMFLNDAIDEEISKKIIINSVKELLVNGPALPVRSEIYANQLKVQVKKAEYGISCIMVLSAQYGIDSFQLRDILVHYKINKKTANQLVESYEKFKDDLSNRLMKYGSSHEIPTLTDIDYEIQQPYIPNGDNIFKLSLKTFEHENTAVLDDVYCNQEELQLLIVKLKDMERHCEQISKAE